MTPPRQPFAYDESPPRSPPRRPGSGTTLSPLGIPRAQPICRPDFRHGPGADPFARGGQCGRRSPVRLRRSKQRGGTRRVWPRKTSISRPCLPPARFVSQPIEKPGLQWGRIDVFWKYAAKPREEVLPTPPSTDPDAMKLSLDHFFHPLRHGFSRRAAPGVAGFCADAPTCATRRATNFYLWGLARAPSPNACRTNGRVGPQCGALHERAALG